MIERPGSINKWQRSGCRYAGDRLCVVGRRKRLLIRIAHTEAAAQIEVAQIDAGIREFAKMARQACEGLPVWRHT